MARLGRAFPIRPHLGRAIVATLLVVGAAPSAPAARTHAATATVSVAAHGLPARPALTTSGHSVTTIAAHAARSAPVTTTQAAAGAVLRLIAAKGAPAVLHASTSGAAYSYLISGSGTATPTVSTRPPAWQILIAGHGQRAAGAVSVGAAHALFTRPIVAQGAPAQPTVATRNAAATLSVVPIGANQIAAALAGQYGPVVIRYRVDWRDAGFRYLGDLSAAFLSGSVVCDNDQTVARTCQLSFDGKALPPNWITTPQAQFCVALWADVYVLGQVVPFGLGCFTLDSPQQSFASGGRELWDVQGADYTFLLASRVTQGPYTAAAGANVISVAQSIIDAQPSGLSRSIPPSPVTLPVAVNWAPQTPWLDIINDLLFGLNYYPLWCTPAGVLTSRPRLDPVTEPIAVVYRTTAPAMVVEPFLRRRVAASEDNICVVAVDDPSRTPSGAAAGTGLFSVTRKNQDPGSPVSLVNDTRERTLDIRGGSTPSTKALPDLVTADAIARTELGLAAARALPATLRTLPDPRRTNNEYYELLIDTVESGSSWRVNKWTYTIPALQGPADVSPPGVTALSTSGAAGDVAMVHELGQVLQLALA